MSVKAVVKRRYVASSASAGGQTAPLAFNLPNGSQRHSVKPKRGFQYTGTDANGCLVKNARIPFESIDEARVRLETAGIKVAKITPLSGLFSFLDYKKNRKPSMTDMASLADQIAAQYKTGLSYDKICKILTRVHPKIQVREALASVEEMISQGSPAYVAFSAQRDKSGKPFFPPTFVYAFQIGEKIGALPDPETGLSGDAPVIMLRFFAKAQRKANEIAKSIFKGLISPVSILVTCVVVFFFQVYVIVPQFAQIFAGLLQGKDAALPLPTRVMLGISDFLYSAGGIALVLAFVASLAAGIYYYFFNEKGIDKRGRLVLRIPILKSFFLPHNAAIFCRNLCILYAETNVTSRFETLAQTTVNPEFRELAEHCREQLLVNAPPFNELFNGHYHLLGEAFAPIAETIDTNPADAQQLLFTYARFLEEEAEEKLAISIATLNKAVFVFAAVMTLFILVASYAPMLDLIGKLSSPGR